MIRVAAVGDIHLGVGDNGTCRAAYEDLRDHADVLLLAGDLTRHGSVAEARVVGAEFADLGVPVVAVLGNHDHHGGEPQEVTGVLQECGITVLDGTGVVLDLPGGRLGIGGAKGFGGGFVGRSAANFGEPEMKAFVAAAQREAALLAQGLGELEAHHVVALTHYSPSVDTLAGEPAEIHPFLGSYLLAECIDGTSVDLAIHGHAHHGTECGRTEGGVPVRNVARPVIRKAYALYHLGSREKGAA